MFCLIKEISLLYICYSCLNEDWRLSVNKSCIYIYTKDNFLTLLFVKDTGLEVLAFYKQIIIKYSAHRLHCWSDGTSASIKYSPFCKGCTMSCILSNYLNSLYLCLLGKSWMHHLTQQQYLTLAITFSEILTDFDNDDDFDHVINWSL